MLVRMLVVGMSAAAQSLFAVSPAGAQSIGVAEGRRCSGVWTSIYNSDQAIVLRGGPLAATAPGASISMACAFQVGWGNDSHASPDVVTASAPELPQVTALAPAAFVRPLPRNVPQFLCTQATVAGVTYYWDGVAAVWSADSRVPCTEAVRQDICGLWDPDCSTWLGMPFEIYTALLGDSTDSTRCPVLRSLAPGVPGMKITPEGDVRFSDEWVAWECPPPEE